VERALIFYVAMALFLANFALGVLVQLRIVDTKPFRWLHHALFFAVFASAAVAVGVGFLQGAPYRWALLPVLALFVVLPRVRAGTPGHAALAGGAMILYVAGFAWML
jgi:peptidoglycan/LPS O-acetylase OafA/YrhL